VWRWTTSWEGGVIDAINERKEGKSSDERERPWWCIIKNEKTKNYRKKNNRTTKGIPKDWPIRMGQ